MAIGSHADNNDCYNKTHQIQSKVKTTEQSLGDYCLTENYSHVLVYVGAEAWGIQITASTMGRRPVTKVTVQSKSHNPSP